jgi:hypothetical protein
MSRPNRITNIVERISLTPWGPLLQRDQERYLGIVMPRTARRRRDIWNWNVITIRYEGEFIRNSSISPRELGIRLNIEGRIREIHQPHD